MLNIKVEEPSIQQVYLKLRAIINKTFNTPLTRRSNLQPRLATALGLLALQTGRYMNAKGRVKQGDPKEALIEVVRGEYSLDLFDNDNLVAFAKNPRKHTNTDKFISALEGRKSPSDTAVYSKLTDLTRKLKRFNES